MAIPLFSGPLEWLAAIIEAPYRGTILLGGFAGSEWDPVAGPAADRDRRRWTGRSISGGPTATLLSARAGASNSSRWLECGCAKKDSLEVTEAPLATEPSCFYNESAS